MQRVDAAFAGAPLFPAQKGPGAPLEFGRQLVNRISGQALDQRAARGDECAPDDECRGGDGATRARLRLSLRCARARRPCHPSTRRRHGLLDEYIDAHAGYNYVEYRNRSLWNVLRAVLMHHDARTG